MNWAKQRAEDVADGFSDAVGNGRLRRELVDAIAAEIQRVADEAVGVAAEKSEHKCGTLWCNDEIAHARADVATDIRAKFPKEGA